MGFDVFNALDLMENKKFLEKLKFGIGDGNLQYYLYNWKCPAMLPEQVCSLIMSSNVTRTGVFPYNVLLPEQVCSLIMSCNVTRIGVFPYNVQ